MVEKSAEVRPYDKASPHAQVRVHCYCLKLRTDELKIDQSTKGDP